MHKSRGGAISPRHSVYVPSGVESSLGSGKYAA